MDANRSDYLSKTLFLKGLQCPKYLYLSKYHPELMDEIPPDRQMRFQAGREVGLYARKLFPGGVEIPYEGQSLSEQVRQTRSEIEKGTTTLYEATFAHEGALVKVDILRKAGGGWEIYEVKSSKEVKEAHPDDVAFQYYVLAETGLPVARASVVYINNQYVRQGQIEVEKLFQSEDLTEEARKREGQIKEELARQREVLKGPMPEIEVGRHCGDPYGCEFQGYCWAEVPEDSVLYLRGGGTDKYALYAQGCRRFADLPLDRLPYHRRIQVEATLQQKDFVNPKKVRVFLKSLRYPLYFLDFETFDLPIPPFDGTRPFQKIPFQYSLHYLETEGGELKHHEFLASPGSDPRQEVARRLVDQVPDDACILVYHRDFEKGILEDLAAWFPEHGARMESLIARTKDLEIPFKSKDLYLRQMRGSSSLKAVLPALVPEMSYEGMEISDGGAASLAYMAVCASDDPEEIERIRCALLEYCRLDTLGMVKIVEAMRNYC
ncbi:MAG: DUF2779 domain-containing protein [candidate division NC10 bacterium]|nr:DUF2779 domain-containing protein [candidate division NC10 bacterium]